MFHFYQTLLLPVLVMMFCQTAVGFVAPRPLSSGRVGCQPPLRILQASPFWISDIPEEAAFTDSIQYMDGTISALLSAFGLAIILLIAFKVATDRMDDAIEQVLVDFEATMEEDFPKQWFSLEQQLEGLQGMERQQKLMQLMEGLEQSDPSFMERINQKMKEKQ